MWIRSHARALLRPSTSRSLVSRAGLSAAAADAAPSPLPDASADAEALPPLDADADANSSADASTDAAATPLNEAIEQIPSGLLSFHWETTPARPHDLDRAQAFFRRAPPTPLWTASELYQVPRSTLPEVAFLGRSNVGKSSLLNALLHAAICRTSSKPGRTRALHAYAVGGHDDRTGAPGAIAVLDMPGYGHGSHAEWGATVSKYLARRPQLRRAYLLVDAQHGLKDRDAGMLRQLRHAGVPHVVVLSKVDRLLLPSGGRRDTLRRGTLAARHATHLLPLIQRVRAVSQPAPRDGVPALGEILATSTAWAGFPRLAQRMHHAMGIDALRWSILVATGCAGPAGKRAAAAAAAGVVVVPDATGRGPPGDASRGPHGG